MTPWQGSDVSAAVMLLLQYLGSRLPERAGWTADKRMPLKSACPSPLPQVSLRLAFVLACWLVLLVIKPLVGYALKRVAHK
jgi:hypothetical protein